MKRLTTEEFIKKSKLIHGDKYDYSLTEYKNCDEDVKIVCIVHGMFKQSPYRHVHGAGCNKCAIVSRGNSRRKSKEQFIKDAIKIHGDKYDYSLVEYVNSQTNVKIICPIHGIFEQLPNNHLKGYECKKCAMIVHAAYADSQRWDEEKFIEEAVKIHGDKYDYSSVRYKNYKSDVEIICPIHGKFKQKANVHLMGCGCRKCVNDKLSSDRICSKEDFIEKSKKIHGDKYDYSIVQYTGAFNKIDIICRKHGKFSQTPTNHLCGKGCSKCAMNNVSKPEIDFLDFIGVPDRNENRHVKINNLIIDGFYNNDVYEFLGDYWHGNPEIYNKNDTNKCNKKTFGQLYENTFNRLNRIKSLGYNVKYIWENDWKQFKTKQTDNLIIRTL